MTSEPVFQNDMWAWYFDLLISTQHTLELRPVELLVLEVFGINQGIELKKWPFYLMKEMKN